MLFCEAFQGFFQLTMLICCGGWLVSRMLDFCLLWPAQGGTGDLLPLLGGSYFGIGSQKLRLSFCGDKTRPTDPPGLQS